MTPYDSPLPSIINDKSVVKVMENNFVSPLHNFKYFIRDIYALFGDCLLLLGFISFVYILWHSHNDRQFQLILLLSFVVTFYSLLRLFVLSYLSLSIGTLDPRLYFSTYVISIFISLPLIFFGSKLFFKNKLLFIKNL